MIVYRVHKIREKIRKEKFRDISLNVDGQTLRILKQKYFTVMEEEFFTRSICHFARCNYIDTIFEFHKIVSKRWNVEYFLTKKSWTKSWIDTRRVLFREALDIRFEDYPIQISTLVPSNKLFLNFPSIIVLFFSLSRTNFPSRVFHRC